MRYQVKTVRGAQADMAREDLGLIKISRSSAEDLFDLGVPVILIGNNVNSHWFFGPAGYNAMTMDPDRFRREGASFKSYVNNWAYYNEQDEGKPAFFVDQKHVAGAREVAPRLTARQRRRGGKPRQAGLGFAVGQRVETHPGTDAWMRGERYGGVVKIGRKTVHVKLDRGGRTGKFHPSRLQALADAVTKLVR